MIVYLHGFRSSPQSFKARLLAARLEELGRAGEWLCPTLPVSPAEAIALAEREIGAHVKPGERVTLIGSSLGGFYATMVFIAFICAFLYWRFHKSGWL